MQNANDPYRPGLVQHRHCLFNKIVDTAVRSTLYIFHDERFKLRTELDGHGSSFT